MSKALGCIPTLYNPKDFLPEDLHISKKMEAVKAFPAEDRIPFSGPVKNQGIVGSCTSHAPAYTKETIEEKQAGAFKLFSIGFIYVFKDGVGQSIDGGKNTLISYDDVLNEEFPYNDDEVRKKLTAMGDDAIYAKACPYRRSRHYRFEPSIKKIKSALLQAFPVVVMLAVYPSFDHLTSDNIALSPDPNNNNKIRGYHALAVLGWRKDGTLIIVNSWGGKHGDKGYVYLSPNYPILEAWIVRR